jgi:hypothetical protein
VVLEYVQVVLEYVQCHVRVQFHCDHYYYFSAVNRTAVRKERSLKKSKINTVIRNYQSIDGVATKVTK